MPEAAIVSTAQSPIGRAVKGSLTDMRPDDLTAQMAEAAPAKVRDLAGNEITDLILVGGHPFGMTGARITAPLINSLQWHDKQFGVESMCVGGGMDMAMLINRLN
jgi:acetyl-CoA acetyltransferase